MTRGSSILYEIFHKNHIRKAVSQYEQQLHTCCMRSGYVELLSICWSTRVHVCTAAQSHICSWSRYEQLSRNTRPGYVQLSYMRSGYERDGREPNRRVKLLRSILTTLQAVFAITFAAKYTLWISTWANMVSVIDQDMVPHKITYLSAEYDWWVRVLRSSRPWSSASPPQACCCRMPWSPGLHPQKECRMCLRPRPPETAQSSWDYKVLQQIDSMLKKARQCRRLHITV